MQTPETHDDPETLRQARMPYRARITGSGETIHYRACRHAGELAPHVSGLSVSEARRALERGAKPCGVCLRSTPLARFT